MLPNLWIFLYLYKCMVGERSSRIEDQAVRQVGVTRSENAGMSSEISVRIINAECPMFPTQRSSMLG